MVFSHYFQIIYYQMLMTVIILSQINIPNWRITILLLLIINFLKISNLIRISLQAKKWTIIICPCPIFVKGVLELDIIQNKRMPLFAINLMMLLRLEYSNLQKLFNKAVIYSKNLIAIVGNNMYINNLMIT